MSIHDSTPAGEVVDRLQALFDGYMQDSEELFRQQEVNMSETLKRYFNMDDLRNSPIHKKFYHDVENTVTELVQLLVQQPSDGLTRRAVSLFLREKPAEEEPCRRSWLIAAEALSIPLIQLLSREEARVFCLDYARQYRWIDMMPRQRELYNTLCRVAELPPKSSGLFARFLSARKKN